MGRQRSSNRLRRRLLRDEGGSSGQLGKACLEVFESELHLSELRVELFGGAAVLHALQACDLETQLLELEGLGNHRGFGALEGRGLLKDQALERFDVVRQIERFGHAAL
jgi:hypothetical protein